LGAPQATGKPPNCEFFADSYLELQIFPWIRPRNGGGYHPLQICEHRQNLLTK
jgi:hypothetical protein